jgi:thioredoxin 1
MKSILYFSTEWCQPCKSFFPVVQEVCSTTGTALQKVDAEQNKSLAASYNVTAVPTIVILGDGNPINRHTGVMSKSQLTNLLIN